MKNCQSCGMPLDEKTTSKFDDTFCMYCQNQNTGGIRTYQEVRVGCIGATIKFMGKNKEEAVKMVDEMLPKLPRWKK